MTPGYMKGLLDMYRHVRPVNYVGRRMWMCPECTRLRLTCEDLGPGAESHYGWTADRGEKKPPRCLRHPKIPMELGNPLE